MSRSAVTLHRLLAAVLLILSTLGLAWGQQTNGTLLGTIVDSSGAVVPGVTVRATNLATNSVRESTTDSAGNYSLPYLPAGDYRVTASHAGFQMQQIDNMTLQVEQTARVDFNMKVGNVSETVNVTSGVALLQTENASVGTVIESGKIVGMRR